MSRHASLPVPLPPDGVLRVHVDINCTAADLARLPLPQRTAFLRGLALIFGDDPAPTPPETR